jgi:hypothetical protein
MQPIQERGQDERSIEQEMVVAHFIVSDDVERSRRFYTDVLGSRTVITGEGNDEVTYVFPTAGSSLTSEGVRQTTSRRSRSTRRPIQTG